ncbi:MAG: exosortase N [Bacteroidia bacterium]
MLLSAIPFLMAYRNLGFTLENIWVVLLPLSIYIRSKGIYSYRMLGVFIPSMLFHVVFQSAFGLYMSLFSLVFLIIESTVGKLNRSAVLVLLLSTPLVVYGFEVFSFPIRKFLSNAATTVLSIYNSEFRAQGSLIFNGDTQFAVDQACSGLKMVVTGFSLMFIWLAYKEKGTNKTANYLGIVVLLLVSLAVVITGNLIRIIVLVAYQIPVTSVWHYWVGMLLIVMSFPLILMAVKRVLKSKFFTDNTVETQTTKPLKYSNWLIVPILFVAMQGIMFKPTEIVKDQYSVKTFKIPGFKSKLLKTEILSLQSANTMIYIKPNKGVFRLDHQPMVCWKGSGFELTEFEKVELFGSEVITGKLRNQSSVLYTAWWYDNGKNRTISQWVWRKQMLLGNDNYKLVNVTASNKSSLYSNIELMFKNSKKLTSK